MEKEISEISLSFLRRKKLFSGKKVRKNSACYESFYKNEFALTRIINKRQKKSRETRKESRKDEEIFSRGIDLINKLDYYCLAEIFMYIPVLDRLKIEQGKSIFFLCFI